MVEEKERERGMVKGRKRGRRREKENGREWSTPVEVSCARQVQAGPVAAGATTLRIRPRVWTFRSRLPAGVHTFLRAGHTRARDFMKTIVSAATARNDDVRSDVNSRSLRSTNLKGIIFHATSHTRALARTTPVDRNTPPARSPGPGWTSRGAGGFIGPRWKKNRVQCSLSTGYGEEAWTRKRNFSFYFILFYFFSFHRGE